MPGRLFGGLLLRNKTHAHQSHEIWQQLCANRDLVEERFLPQGTIRLGKLSLETRQRGRLRIYCRAHPEQSTLPDIRGYQNR